MMNSISMKNMKYVLVGIAIAWQIPVSAQGRKENFDNGWRFHRGIVANAEAADFDDSHWRVLNLPHDWSVEPLPMQREGTTIGPFTRASVGRWDTGETEGGEGWYRKTFQAASSDRNRRVVLHVEGAYNEAEVYVNGQKLFYNHYGYQPFKVDISKQLKFGNKDNVIAIRVVNAGLNTRWYAGSGLYRHVWLEHTDRTCLDEWDTYVNATIPATLTKNTTRADADISISTIVHNYQKREVSGEVEVEIDGRTVTEPFSVGADHDRGVNLHATIKKAQLWSVEHPNLYKAYVRVKINKETVDEITIPFGVRKIEATAEKGFLLNGKSIKLKGACVHHDHGLLGAAAPDRAEIHKVEQLKGLGYNAVRCSHNLPSEQFLHVCDSLGLLVMDEVFDQWLEPKRDQDYHRHFMKYAPQDMALMVRRDRNHPSVIIWSIGNEIPGRIKDAGMDVARMLREVIHANDTTRFISAGICDWDYQGYPWKEMSAKAFQSLDIAGYNYLLRHYDEDHNAYPDRIIMGTESFPQDVAKIWNYTEKHNYCIGDFVWTAIDYVGEAGLANNILTKGNEGNQLFMDWPWFNSWCGDIDLAGNKKPQSYLRDVVWRRSNIEMAVHPPLPEGMKEKYTGWGWRREENHWTWDGFEGQPMTVRVFSRAPKVSLSLNGKLIGEQEVNRDTYEAVFTVNYEPGELVAKNLGSRAQAGAKVFKTTGVPAKVVLSADRNPISASHNDLSYVSISVLDKDGNVCPRAEVPLKVETSGAKAIVVCGNGNPIDLASFRSFTPKTFRGQALAIVQAQDESGTVSLKVSSEGLEGAEIGIEMVSGK